MLTIHLVFHFESYLLSYISINSNLTLEITVKLMFISLFNHLSSINAIRQLLIIFFLRGGGNRIGAKGKKKKGCHFAKNINNLGLNIGSKKGHYISQKFCFKKILFIVYAYIIILNSTSI